MTTLHLSWLCLVGGVAFGLGLVLGAGMGSGALACCTKKGRAELAKRHKEIVEKAARELTTITVGAVEVAAAQRKQPPADVSWIRDREGNTYLVKQAPPEVDTTK